MIFNVICQTNSKTEQVKAKVTIKKDGIPYKNQGNTSLSRYSINKQYSSIKKKK